MKIAVDTNVLVSATFWYGASHRILLKVESKEIELILSQDILREYAEVLGYEEITEKIANKGLEMKRSIGKIISMSTIVQPSEKLNVISDDPDDNIILECAIAGNVDYIISKDNHLLKLKKYRNIPIVAPEEFEEKYK